MQIVLFNSHLCRNELSTSLCKQANVINWNNPKFLQLLEEINEEIQIYDYMHLYALIAHSIFLGPARALLSPGIYIVTPKLN